MSDDLSNPFTSHGLRILDLNLVDGKLRGELRLSKAADGALITLAFVQPDTDTKGKSLLDGFLVQQETSELESSSRRYMPDFLGGASGGKLYSWSDAQSEGKTAVVILPSGHSASDLSPAPSEIGCYDGRIALAWKSAPRHLKWLLRKAESENASAEVELLQGRVRKVAQRQKADASRSKTRRVAVVAGLLAVILVVGFLGGRILTKRHSGNESASESPAMRGVRLNAPAFDEAPGEIYGKSYALVVGIDKYPADGKWASLSYARRDAEGFAEFLREQEFDEIFTLYDEKATKTGILHVMQIDVARRAQKEDRIVVFFAGHGHTEQLGGKDWGYLVPADAGDSSATYISMEELQTQSEKMGLAKHQLFVLDACYGGLFAMRSGGVDETTPNYINEITRRTARQVMTAGGSDQQVLDGGPGGHSVFTGHFLEAIRKGLADNNGDGYVTFAELTSYVLPRASNQFQTPASSSLPGHGNGEFVFKAKAVTAAEDEEEL